MKHTVFLVGVFFIAAGLATAQAETYPNHPIHLIIPMDAGSAGDTVVRPFADELARILKTPVVVNNKPGASGTLGTDQVVKSKKDGYTLLYANSSALVYAKASNPETVPYDPIKDLEPLGFHCFFPLTIAVLDSAPWKTFGELIDYAKKNPGKIRVSTSGQGSIDHFNQEIIQSLTGAQFTLVPFKGAAAVLTALLGGHVDMICIANSLSSPQVKAGKMRMLLLTNKIREYPDVPTAVQLGYPRDLLSPWFALFGPTGIPDEVKKILIPAIEKAIKAPEFKSQIEKLGFVVEYKTPVDLKKLVVSEYETARNLALKLGMSK